MNKFYGISIQLLVIFSIIALSIETLPDLSDEMRDYLWLSEILVVAIFTIEYFWRSYKGGRKYNFSFLGVVDIAAILPFYLSLGLDARVLRIVRIYQLFRILKFGRYANAMERFGKAIVQVKEEILVFLVATFLVMYLSAVGIYFFEHEAQPEVFASIFHSLWWSVATLTAVGYGDVYPITIGGKIFTFIILMMGLGVVAMPAGLISIALSQVIREEKDNRKSPNGATDG